MYILCVCGCGGGVVNEAKLPVLEAQRGEGRCVFSTGSYFRENMVIFRHTLRMVMQVKMACASYCALVMRLISFLDSFISH